MQVSESPDGNLHWMARNHQGDMWLEVQLEMPGLALLTSSDDQAGKRLSELFQAICELRPDFAETITPSLFQTRLEFPNAWGLGTSSTLVSLLAEWAKVDSFALLQKTFGGSGYDLACARAAGPLLYRLRDQCAHWVEIPFQPAFRDQLFFVYLGNKQNSREGIQHYRTRQRGQDPNRIRTFDRLSWAMASASTLDDFEAAIREHEIRLSKLLEMPRVKERFFEDYSGEVKSLGAWGGDFVMATARGSEEETRAYFRNKGFPTIFRADELLFG
jgi:hypothetical protein